MPSKVGPSSVESQLVFAFDVADAKNSYLGKPTVNYIDNPTEEMPRGEFGQYRNLATTFDAEGLVPYSLSMDIKTNKPGGVFVYMQNGSYSKYGFVGSSVNATMEYQRFKFENITPVLSTAWQQNTPDDNRAMLATYTGYGSGVNPTVKNIQLEKGTYSTPFVNGSRTNTTGLLDLTGRTTIDLNTASFDSSGQIVLDGTDDRIDLGNVSDYFTPGVRAITVEAAFKITPGASGPPAPIFENYRFNLWYWYSDDTVNLTTRTGPPETAGYQFAVGHTGTVACRSKGNYNHIVAIYETLGNSIGRVKIWVNGVYAGSSNGIKMGSYPIYPTWIGQSYHSGYGTYKLNGKVDIIRVYTGALTDDEISENYKSLKTRFGI